MKVLHVTPFYGSEQVGGTERFVSNIISEQIKNPSIQVKVLSTRKIGSLQNDSNLEVDVIRFPNIRTIGSFNPFAIINPFNRIFNWADIVHVHSPLYFLSIQVIPMVKALGKKVVLHVHGGLGKPPSTIKGLLPKIKPIFDRTLIKCQMRLADLVLTVNGKDISYITKDLNIKKDKVQLLNNAINIDMFDPPKRSNGIPKKFKFLYVGDLERWKGVEDLIQAISELEDGLQKKIELNLVGGGAEMDYLMELSLKHDLDIIFHGKKPHDEIPLFMQQSDIFVHTGHWEGMPTTLLEATASKLPVISSTAGHAGNFLEEENNGLLYSPGNISELSKKILWSIQNYPNMVDKAELAYGKIRSEFSIEGVSKSIIRNYMFLLN